MKTMYLSFIYFGQHTWILIPGILLMFYAQYKVMSTFKKYSRVGSKANITGAEVARILIQARGLNVPVERSGGRLSDHYDPFKKVVRLSPGVHDSTSVAALGVAAHETGHALQHADGYKALVARNSFIPVAGFASQAMMPLLLLSFFTGFRIPWLLIALGVCFGIFSLFALITLPIEFNASSRAMKLLGNTGILAEDEAPKARAVLNAAALTYVASAVYAISNLIAIFFLGSRD
jgi:Zn-dependent membrane protease YugP